MKKTLQDKSIEVFFNEYLLNSELSENTKNLFVTYLKNNKEILHDYFATEKIYHVYMRQQDTDIDYKNLQSHDVHLLSSFVTLEDATNWILKNGKKIINVQEENYATPIVLFIIEKSNNDFDITSLYYDTDMNMIFCRRYPTYAFSKEAYDMLLDEHWQLFNGDSRCNDIFPYWIHRVRNKCVIQSG